MKPELVSEWSLNNERTPTDFVYTSQVRVLCNCSTCGNEYEAPINKQMVVMATVRIAIISRS